MVLSVHLRSRHLKVWILDECRFWVSGIQIITVISFLERNIIYFKIVIGCACLPSTKITKNARTFQLKIFIFAYLVTMFIY